MKVLKSSPPLFDFKQITRIESELATEVKREEKFWEQKSRIAWLKSGHSNSSFFHASVMGRRRRNQIWGIQDSVGVRHSDLKGI